MGMPTLSSSFSPPELQAPYSVGRLINSSAVLDTNFVQTLGNGLVSEINH